MKKVPIGEIEPGAVVARPVTSSCGVVLVQPGTVLTAELLSRLDTLRVEHVWLEGAAPGAKSTEELLAELEQRFVGHDGNPLMAKLKQMVATRITRGEAGGRDDG